VYLIEAISEKDYMKEQIELLKKHISNLLATDDERDIKLLEKDLKERFNELQNLYKKYQKFLAVIERAKASINIQFENTTLTLGEALIFRDSLIEKLNDISYIYNKALEQTNKHLVIDIETLLDLINELRLDIKTLNYKINKAYWTTTISGGDKS